MKIFVVVCREVPEAVLLARVQAKADELSSNSLLADAAREGVDYRQGLNSLPETSDTQTAASDWFKVCSMCVIFKGIRARKAGLPL